MSLCNICGGSVFKKNPNSSTCRTCGSMDRHRAFKYVLEHRGYLASTNDPPRRVLHFAPESSTASFLQPVFGSGYFAADAEPSNYSFVKSLRINLPDGLEIFPSEYFDLILHNHVMEHIPGDWRTHIMAFHRILKKSGEMIFTVPMTNKHRTMQFGEDLDDEQRASLFGQSNHLKLFGTDFVQTFDCFNCEFEVITPPLIDNTNLYLWRNQVFCYKRR